MCQEYNGWTNRETWATNLWIDNDRGLYERVQEITEEAMDSVRELADNIQGLFEELFDMENIFGDYGKELIIMSQDIGSLYRVNWHEIAESKLLELKTQEEANA